MDRVTIVVPDGLVVVGGVAYRGLDLEALARGQRELPPAPVVVVEAPEPVAESDAGPVEVPAPEPELAPAAPQYLETVVHAVQWHGASGWVEEFDLDGQPLPNRAIESLDAFKPALDAWQAAHTAATTPRQLTMSEIRAKGLMDVDQQHQMALIRLTGNPTDAERNTWAGKVELARRILDKQPLLLDQESFLTQRGLTTAGQRLAYANEVMTNSARYWTLVGMADKVRSEAKARIMAVQTMAGWAECGRANREAAAKAMAEAMALLDGGLV